MPRGELKGPTVWLFGGERCSSRQALILAAPVLGRFHLLLGGQRHAGLGHIALACREAPRLLKDAKCASSRPRGRRSLDRETVRLSWDGVTGEGGCGHSPREEQHGEGDMRGRQTGQRVQSRRRTTRGG